MGTDDLIGLSQGLQQCSLDLIAQSNRLKARCRTAYDAAMAVRLSGADACARSAALRRCRDARPLSWKGGSMTSVDWKQRAPGRWRAEIGEWVLLVSDVEGGGFVWQAAGGDFYFDGGADTLDGAQRAAIASTATPLS